MAKICCPPRLLLGHAGVFWHQQSYAAGVCSVVTSVRRVKVPHEFCETVVRSP